MFLPRTAWHFNSFASITYQTSLEPFQWAGSFEHPKHMFKLKGKKIITISHFKNFLIKTYGELYSNENYQQGGYRPMNLITLCMLGNFTCFCCRQLTFLKISFLKKIFQDHYQSVKQFGSRSGPTFVRPDMGPNCLQRLSADNKNCR